MHNHKSMPQKAKFLKSTQAQDLLAKQDTLRQESAQLVKDIADLQERIEKREDTIQNKHAKHK